MKARIYGLFNQSNQSDLIKDHLSNYSDISSDSLQLLLLPNSNTVKSDTLPGIYHLLSES